MSSIKQKTEKPCRECGVVFRLFNSTDKFCSLECSKKNQKPSKPKKTTRIPVMSSKRKVEHAQYLKDRIDFLNLPENKVCFIDGCNRSATTIEHTAGRIGTKFLDKKYWKPCCFLHNSELERNTEMSNKYQLSKFHDGKKINKRT